MSRETLICFIRNIYFMPHDIAHIHTDTTDGMLWVETDHATAAALSIGDRAVFEGERTVERTIMFLINVRRWL